MTNPVTNPAVEPKTDPVPLKDIVVHFLLDQLADALRRHDGDAAVAVVKQLYIIAGHDWTDRLVDDLIAAGLRRLADHYQNGGSQ
jgi:hypothetical protein